jgi:hypothetical protein
VAQKCTRGQPPACWVKLRPLGETRIGEDGLRQDTWGETQTRQQVQFHKNEVEEEEDFEEATLAGRCFLILTFVESRLLRFSWICHSL